MLGTQDKTNYIKMLASGVRTRVRMELQNLKTIKSNDSNYFVTRSSQALSNIIPCFSNDHSKCSKASTVCQHHMSSIRKYSVKHLPYGQHLHLSNTDSSRLKDTISSTFDTETLQYVSNLYNGNRCESLHSTIFNYAPKFTCWKRNFSGLCHSATHSQTLGKGRATFILARTVGIKVKQHSQMYRNLQHIDKRSTYHSRRKESFQYKQTRYFLRKRVSNLPLLKDSLYSSQPSSSAGDHTYGISY